MFSDMSQSLNPLKGDYMGEYHRLIISQKIPQQIPQPFGFVGFDIVVF